MGWQDDPIDTPNSIGQVPSASPPAWASDPIDGEPNHPQATHTFARTLGNAVGSAVNTMKEGSSRSMETLGDIGQVYPVIEAGLNAATGVLFGFPAYVGAGLGGLAGKYLLGNEADPKALAEMMQQLFTYQPMTERGIRLSGNVMYPLQKLMEGSDFTGEKVTDFAVNHGASDTTATWSGAITSSTLQMIPGVLLGEFGRKMGGQTITNNDFANTSKIIAGSEATPADVHSVETSLRATYDKTGIGPFTVMDEAMKSPSIKSELLNPSVDVPKPFAVLQPPITGEWYVHHLRTAHAHEHHVHFPDHRDFCFGVFIGIDDVSKGEAH